MGKEQDRAAAARMDVGDGIWLRGILGTGGVS
jgi:hypothetical protein